MEGFARTVVVVHWLMDDTEHFECVGFRSFLDKDVYSCDAGGSPLSLAKYSTNSSNSQVTAPIFSLGFLL